MSSNFPNDPSNPYSGAGYAGPQGTSGKAIASLILGLSSLFCSFFTGIPAIIFGALGLGDISRSGGRLAGRGMAIAGLVLGVVGSTLATVAILVALLLPAVQAARSAALRNQSQNKLKQIGIAMLNYESVHKHFPGGNAPEQPGQPPVSWRVAILQDVEEASLANQYHKDEPWDGPNNKPLAAKAPEIFVAPQDKSGTSFTSLYVIADPDSAFPDGNALGRRDMQDGPSNTIFAVELGGGTVPWSEARDISTDEFIAALHRAESGPGLHRIYPRGVNCLFGDGTVRFVSDDVDEKILRAMCTRAGGEQFAAP